MNPTILIGLDGATFTVLDPLMADGTMPFLREFVAGGVGANLRSTPNPLTPPAWTSMITGRSPGHHGVFDFIWAEHREKEHYFTLYNYRDIRCETIWSIVNRHGGSVGALNFPVMAPPPPLEGYIIPGLVSWKHLRRNVHPREVYAELKELPGFNPRELAWDFDMEKKAAKGVPEEEWENWIEFHIRRERQWFEVVRHLMTTRPSDLVAIVFDGPDKLSHMGWRFLDPMHFPASPSPRERRLRDLCLQYFREVDGFLAEIVKLAGPEANVFMASDHGFGPSFEVLRINTWLAEQGYLHWKDTSAASGADREAVDRLVENHFVLLDWDRTTAYAHSVTANGIFIRVADGVGGPGVPPGDYERFRAELIEKLKTIRDPETGERIVTSILPREDAFPGANNRRAPDLTLVMRDHSFVSILDKQPIVCRRPGIEGTHYPEGIFLARGPGIRAGGRLSELSILDVAPALLYSLGLEIPRDFEGRVPEPAFREDLLRSRPWKLGAPSEAPQSYLRSAVLNAAEDQDERGEIMKRLRALGYVE